MSSPARAATIEHTPGLRARSRAATALFLALVLVPLVPLWSAVRFPSQDGPAHLEIGMVLRQLLGDDPGAFARYFQIDTAPEPNWLVYPLLVVLQRWASPDVAEKILVSLYLIALPLSILLAVRTLRPEAAPLAFLGLPLALNYPLHMGFYNFVFGLALFFLVVTFHARCRVPMSGHQTISLALLLLLTYFCHPVALAMGLLAIGCSIVASVATVGEKLDLRRLVRAVGAALLAAAPSLLLLAAFVAGERSETVEPMSFATLLRQLAVLYSLVSYDRAQVAVSATVMACFGVLTLVVVRARAKETPLRRAALAPGDGFLAALAVTTALYFLVPAAAAGGGYLNQRLQLYIVFFLLLWLATRPEVDRFRRAIVGVGAALAVASAVLHGAYYARIGGYLVEYDSAAPSLAPRSTILPVSFDHRGTGDGRRLSLRVFPFEHAAGRVAAARELIDLNSYQASRGYFPIAYRSDCDPLRWLGSAVELSSESPVARLDAYAAAPGCAIDYVLVWAASAAAHRESALLRELDRSFERVFVSRRGLLEVYRRRAEPSLAGEQSAANR